MLCIWHLLVQGCRLLGLVIPLGQPLILVPDMVCSLNLAGNVVMIVLYPHGMQSSSCMRQVYAASKLAHPH